MAEGDFNATSIIVSAIIYACGYWLGSTLANDPIREARIVEGKIPAIMVKSKRTETPLLLYNGKYITQEDIAKEMNKEVRKNYDSNLIKKVEK